VPIAVLAFMVMAGLGAAMTALKSGNVEAAVGPLLMTAFAVFVLWRRLQRRNDLSARSPRDS
jgi:membrane protein implicated in regulation of membrane protease activity